MNGGLITMTYRINEDILGDYKQKNLERLIENFCNQYQKYITDLSCHEKIKELKSGHNRVNRSHMWSSEAMKMTPKIGDICFIDYGHAYLNESGYQHFGLIIGSSNQKILVVPMTSKRDAISQSRNVVEKGKLHLYYIGHLDGLHKPSTLFLNDFKYLNSARVISINGHLCINSTMFKDIVSIIKNEMF